MTIISLSSVELLNAEPFVHLSYTFELCLFFNMLANHRTPYVYVFIQARRRDPFLFF